MRIRGKISWLHCFAHHAQKFTEKFLQHHPWFSPYLYKDRNGGRWELSFTDCVVVWDLRARGLGWESKPRVAGMTGRLMASACRRRGILSCSPTVAFVGPTKWNTMKKEKWSQDLPKRSSRVTLAGEDFMDLSKRRFYGRDWNQMRADWKAWERRNWRQQCKQHWGSPGC